MFTRVPDYFTNNCERTGRREADRAEGIRSVGGYGRTDFYGDDREPQLMRHRDGQNVRNFIARIYSWAFDTGEFGI